MEWYLSVVSNYVQFDGRARRKEYWMFALFSAIITVVLAVVDGVIGWGPWLCGVYTLAMILPNVAVTIRRLHDTNRSGWWALISGVPAVGGIILLVLMCLEGDLVDNRFGQNPKNV